jgi:hypothetical protein
METKAFLCLIHILILTFDPKVPQQSTPAKDPRRLFLEVVYPGEKTTLAILLEVKTTLDTNVIT